MTTVDGFVAFNLLCYDMETFDKAITLISSVKAESKLYIESESEMNRVVFLTKSKASPYDERVPNLEKLLKKWNCNKGIWFTENRVKEYIEKFKEI